MFLIDLNLHFPIRSASTMWLIATKIPELQLSYHVSNILSIVNIILSQQNRTKIRQRKPPSRLITPIERFITCPNFLLFSSVFICRSFCVSVCRVSARKAISGDTENDLDKGYTVSYIIMCTKFSHALQRIWLNVNELFETWLWLVLDELFAWRPSLSVAYHTNIGA